MIKFIKRIFTKAGAASTPNETDKENFYIPGVEKIDRAYQEILITIIQGWLKDRNFRGIKLDFFQVEQVFKNGLSGSMVFKARFGESGKSSNSWIIKIATAEAADKELLGAE